MALPTSESVGTGGYADSASSLTVGTGGWVLPAGVIPPSVSGQTVIGRVSRRIIEEDEVLLLSLHMLGDVL